MPSSPKKTGTRTVSATAKKIPRKPAKPISTAGRNADAVAREAGGVPRIDFRINTSRFKNPYNKTKTSNALNKPIKKAAKSAAKPAFALNKPITKQAKSVAKGAGKGAAALNKTMTKKAVGAGKGAAALNKTMTKKAVGAGKGAAALNKTMTKKAVPRTTRSSKRR
jgi:hypothetical protein